MSLKESHRVLKNGGSIHKAQTTLPVDMPFRVYPGKLTVTRILGEIEAKDPKYGGKPNVVIADPDIFEVSLKDEDDFILLGSNGVYAKSTNEEIVNFIFLEKERCKNAQERSAKAVDSAIKLAAFKKSNSNLSAILIALRNYIPYTKEDELGGLTIFSKINLSPLPCMRLGKEKANVLKSLVSSPKMPMSPRMAKYESTTAIGQNLLAID